MNKVDVVARINEDATRDCGVVLGDHFSIPITVTRKNTSSNKVDESYYEDNITLIVPIGIDEKDSISFDYKEGQYFLLKRGKLINKVTSNFNIDVAISAKMSDIIPIDEDEAKDHTSSVSIIGTVTSVFTTEENYSNFYNCIVETQGTTVRVISWGSLANFMMKNVEEGTLVKIDGFINTVLHKEGLENTVEVLSAFVSILDKSGDEGAVK